MKLTLEILEGPHAGSTFAFDRHTTFLVGRSESAHLQLVEDRHFSRHHFLLEVNPPRCYLRDLGSRNGTLVNGARVKEAFLKDGDIISGGKTRIRLRLQSQASAPAPPPPACLACGTRAEHPTLSAQEKPSQTQSYVCTACREEIQNHPQPVPGYEILRRLGKGGMGVVHLAHRKSTGAAVAVKLVVPESATSDRAIQLFLREISVLSQLDHPRIVTFHEAGTTGGQFYFIMEYIEAVHLSDVLAPLPKDKQTKAICGVLCQVLDALSYAHKKSFVHRDVKPSNILVSQLGLKLRAKLSDFGLGKSLENAGFSGMTRTGMVCGSLPYMPPEQVLDCRLAQPQADLYSAGATLYALLTNTPPHDLSEGKDPYAVILDEPPVPLGERRTDLPTELIEIVHRALAKTPGERFATALEMRRALLPFAKGLEPAGA